MTTSKALPNEKVSKRQERVDVLLPTVGSVPAHRLAERESRSSHVVLRFRHACFRTLQPPPIGLGYVLGHSPPRIVGLR